MDIFKCALQHFVGDFARLLYGTVHNLFNVTSRIQRCPQNRMSDARPQHRELHALLFTNTVSVLSRPTGILRVVRRDLRLTVLIREDLKVYPFADVITKARFLGFMCAWAISRNTTGVFELTPQCPRGSPLTSKIVWR